MRSVLRQSIFHMFLFESWHEAFSNTIFFLNEAFNCNLPIICTATFPPKTCVYQGFSTFYIHFMNSSSWKPRLLDGNLTSRWKQPESGLSDQVGFSFSLQRNLQWASSFCWHLQDSPSHAAVLSNFCGLSKTVGRTPRPDSFALEITVHWLHQSPWQPVHALCYLAIQHPSTCPLSNVPWTKWIKMSIPRPRSSSSRRSWAWPSYALCDSDIDEELQKAIDHIWGNGVATLDLPV